MGIRRLLPALDTAIAPCHIRDLSGQRAGIDVSGWIHRVLGKKCVKQFILQQLQLLRQYNIEPVLVFDGPEPEAKREVVEARARQKAKYMAEAQELLDNGDEEGANKLLLRTGVRTEEMQDSLKSWCRLNGVWYVQSPFEADAQLAFLMQSKMIDFVISEDADMILYGCSKVLLKWKYGKGQLFQESKMPSLWGAPFDMDCFRAVCIAVGCDYLRGGVKHFGIGRAKNVFNQLSPTFTFNRFMKLLNKQPGVKVVKVGDDFPNAFMRAVSTFKYQLVFNPATNGIVPVTPYPTGASHLNFPYAPKAEPKEICKVCKKAFWTTKRLKQHEGTHKKKTIPCTHAGCDKVFARKDSMEEHLLSHTNQHLVKCDKCFEVFAGRGRLNNHKRLGACKAVPQPEKPKLQCSKCLKYFANDKTMKAHLKLIRCKRNQQPNKPKVKSKVRCAGCLNDFASAKGLREHLRLGRCKCKQQPKITDYFRPQPEE